MFFYTEEVAQGKVRKNVLCVKRLPHFFAFYKTLNRDVVAFFCIFLVFHFGDFMGKGWVAFYRSPQFTFH